MYIKNSSEYSAKINGLIAKKFSFDKLKCLRSEAQGVNYET